MHQDRAGLLYALAGFCTLSIGDAIIKGMPGAWPATAMAVTRYGVGTAVLAVLLARAEGFAALRLPHDGLQWLRGISISISALCMFFAVWIMPLAEATTIAFTQPIFTAILAVIVLGERARAATWIAIALALAGVALVLRPNFENAGWGALLPLVAAGGMAVAIIANRAASGQAKASILAMQYYMSVTAFVVLIAATAVTHLAGFEGFRLHIPEWSVAARCAFIGLSATLAQWLIFMGTVKAGAGTVAPMTYGQLLMAVALGWTFFGDKPDATATLGAAIIIGAGLFLWWTGRSSDPERAA